MTIKQKQCLLAYLGYYTGSVDGIWGNQSRAATESFQRDHQLSVDGTFGEATAQRAREVIASGEEPVKLSQQPQSGSGADWWKEIRYFTREEFRCPCSRCGGFPVEPEESIVRLADRVRGHFGAPATVSSGVRCVEHNREVGGVAASRHLRGKAMDFTVSGVAGSTVLAYVQSMGGVRYAYAIDSSFVHMDVE